jgi:CBS domain-containing protein
MTVHDVLQRKGCGVIAVSPEQSVHEAALRMNEAHIGAVVVFDPERGLVGIFSERDVLARVVAECRSPKTTAVGEVMTSPVTCCKPCTPLDEIKAVMTNKRLRHLPVVDETELVGIISIGDILAQQVDMQQSTIEYMNEYLHGRA